MWLLLPRNRAESVLQILLERADIRVGGSRPWDLRVHDDRFYARVLGDGTLGLGESYMDGWWDCDALDQFVYRVLRAGVREAGEGRLQRWMPRLLALLTNRQSRSRAFQIGERHYDLGNDLFDIMLDPRRTYSCGYWNGVASLEEAQESKLELICRKIGISAGQSVLDVGCGWGSFLGYVAEKHRAGATGITVSRDQAFFARERFAPLPVEIRLQDYRDLDGLAYDHVVSVGMFEHVGARNHRTFMETVHRCLKEHGLFLLHTIVGRETSRSTDPWIDKYIFPNGVIPSPQQIASAIEGLFVVEDVHEFGSHYDPTLMAWHENFTAGWPRIAAGYGERFYRMWRYYLLTCAGSFRARWMGVWQVVLSKQGVPGGYRSVR